MEKLTEIQINLIQTAKRGYPILLAGAIFFFLISFAPLFFSLKALGLIWIVGLGVIFPAGILIARMLGINLMTDNPLGKLGGLVAGTQMFYLPVFILIYQQAPAFVPFTIGLLGGSHFLPYTWIYKSKAYFFITVGTCASSLLLGLLLLDQAYVLVPLAISTIYSIGIMLLFKENKKSDNTDEIDFH
ncbi:DUF7010 family protein [Fictibacillus sp. BK138]|uniref:DUF7010 family protein n=1 Tax=Fictibacillus sp. BK138 TaxID=2512121 RepID=UPI0010290ECA|nr:hypothetical protein [Fictibacillus sp. BK138]RZT15494.1 hypothetical protein EV282_3697 [Fictibacillus sp. BK138]